MKTHDPEDPKCWCEECVCRNYPEIAARHANCRMASEDVEYRKLQFEGAIARAVETMWVDFKLAGQSKPEEVRDSEDLDDGC